MTPDACFWLGYLVRPLGMHGELVARFDVDEPEDYLDLNEVWVEEPSGELKLMALRDISFNPHKLEFNLQFKDIADRTTAEAWCGRALYLPLEKLPPLEGNSFYYHEIVGYEAVDKRLGPIGTIVRVLDMPAHPVLEIAHKGRSILAPITDDFIMEVNRGEERLILDLPEGLVELYMD